MAKKKAAASGWAKLRSAGKKGIMLAVTQEEYETLRAAADIERRSLSGYIVFQALEAARRMQVTKTTA